MQWLDSLNTFVSSLNPMATSPHWLFSQFNSPSGVDHYAGDLTYLEILVALTVASILGAIIAYHPKRNIEISGPVTDKELRKTQIVICVAGAIMVALIQGSLERAFGLVGLGSFVRYRTALRNPYDLSIIFILIGLGMACGLQYYEFAITITCFVFVLMYLLDAKTQIKTDIWTYKVDTSDPDRVEKAFQKIANENKFTISLIKTNKELGRFHCRFTSSRALDKDQINEQIKSQCGEEVVFVRFDWEQQIKNT